jgi:hypothetical protein
MSVRVVSKSYGIKRGLMVAQASFSWVMVAILSLPAVAKTVQLYGQECGQDSIKLQGPGEFPGRLTALQGFLAEAEATALRGAVMEAEEELRAMQHPERMACKAAAHALALVQVYMDWALVLLIPLDPLVVAAIRNLEPLALAA